MSTTRPGRRYVFREALLPEGWCHEVLAEVDGTGNFVAVRPGATRGERLDRTEHVQGIVIPGVPNVHSHAHQRALAGLTERAGPGDDSFWTWREAMYDLVSKLDAESLAAIAAELYVEMLEAGYTAVGEFHYVHHQPDGNPYDEPAELSLALLEAAEEAGIGITLLPTLYAAGGFGGVPVDPGQIRFANDAGSYLRIVERIHQACAGRDDRAFGISPHSLRAVPEALLRDVLSSLDELDARAPVHIHIAEQTREVDDCVAWSGARPVQWLLEHFDVDDRWCLIHATHMTDAEIASSAATGAVAGLCPSTEANLGDGIFAAREFLAAAGRIAIGSDSQISVSPAEELRALEYSQRLVHRSRNVLAGGPQRSTARTLLDAVSSGGALCMSRPIGAIDRGRRADFVVLDDAHPALIERSGDAVLDSWVFSAGNRCIKDVYVGGIQQVRGGRHVRGAEILERFRAACHRLREG
ncbi:MAG: formimidoylglutamate deiminase [Gammaproteobacteria bacterium]